MISEFFVNLAAGFVGWLAGLFGEWTPPDALTDMASSANDLVVEFASLGVWVDWGVLSGCVAAALASWAVVLVVKVVRALAAHVPVIGGAGD
ncbi:hypothetical protein [Microbacterium suwonense]|uniref:Uncharacterized protein n=1 Tax=Microbacterium suwonense TaxID=683047 RepID=A0ABM8FR04_9MICO|nr:hypothetical protein [Microbacterium suwonense]BDZ38074.1 hypothetical protein GCM10025863_06880 [Microbacterium suwonense]